MKELVLSGGGEADYLRSLSSSTFSSEKYILQNGFRVQIPLGPRARVLAGSMDWKRVDIHSSVICFQSRRAIHSRSLSWTSRPTSAASSSRIGGSPKSSRSGTNGQGPAGPHWKRMAATEGSLAAIGSHWWPEAPLVPAPGSGCSPPRPAAPPPAPPPAPVSTRSQHGPGSGPNHKTSSVYMRKSPEGNFITFF